MATAKIDNRAQIRECAARAVQKAQLEDRQDHSH